LYWVYWLVIILGVSAEWGLVYWGADFMVHAIGLTPANAATAMTLFFMAMVIGRFAGSRLTRRVASGRLLLAAVAIALTGFLFFWLARLAALNLFGLFVAGLGVANLYPLTLAVATTVAADQADKASARISVGGGAAIFAAPLLLGWTADQLDIAQAYTIVAALLLVALVVTAAAYRYQRRVEPVETLS
jgi:fucose permease